MSQEFYQKLALIHDSVAREFARNNDGVQRHVECRCHDKIYVYLYEGDVHVQTQVVEIPDAWFDNWPSDATARKHVHKFANIGSVRITTLDG